METADQYLPTAESNLQQQISKTIGTDWWEYVTQELPEWWDFPHQINAKVTLWLWSLDRAFGMRDYAKLRYGLLGNAEHWFPGKKAIQTERMDWQNLLKDSPFLDVIPERLREAHELFGETEIKRLSESD